MLDEAETEAWFIVSEIVLSRLDKVKETWPNWEDRLKYYRMRVGYGLKNYFAHRPPSSLHDMRRKGLTGERLQLEPEHTMTWDTPWLELYEEVLTTDLLHDVIALKIQGMSIDKIAAELAISPNAVQKAIRTVKRRIRRVK